MNAEWHSAIVKGIPYLFHHCRQLANERKHHGKPPEMEYVLARGCLGGFFVKVVRLPAHMWCSRGVTCARYVEMGIGGEATVTKAEVDNWFREMLKVAQQTYCLKLQFRSLRAIPSDVLHLENLRELDVVGNTLVRAQTCRSERTRQANLDPCYCAVSVTCLFMRLCAVVQEVIPSTLRHFHGLRRLVLRSNRTRYIEPEVSAGLGLGFG